LAEVSPKEVQINEKDLDWKYTRGTGPGGQHKNKTDSCVSLTHIPTGIKVKVDGRSQSSNKANALFVLKARLKEQQVSKFYNNRADVRKQQVGSGMRGDKIRTIRVRDNKVTDHELNVKMSYKEYSRGDLSKLR
jgi:peptide chain release factor 1